MSQSKAFIFDPHDLLQLLCHYTDGGVPLGGEVISVGFNPFLERFIGLEVESEEWDTSEPLQLRYEGRRVMSWQSGMGKEGDKPFWSEAGETPQKQ